MKKQEKSTIPELQLGVGDLGVIRDILQAYQAFLPRSGLSLPDRERETLRLKGLLEKLAHVPQQDAEGRITLTLPEIYVLRSATQVFVTFVKQKVAQSRERDETLEAVARLRQDLLNLLPRSRNLNRII